MDHESHAVTSHYARSDLLGRILDALAAAGHDPEAPDVTALRGLDHLHGGGFHATREQVRLAGIARGSHVLDAGCGIGGPSRYLATELGCIVEGLDLTPDFVAVARALNARTGLGDRITVEEGSVTDLPFADARFDAVLSQNVSMNVSDKGAMLREAFRVLKPGGIYTLSHIAEGPDGAPIYPLPWALTPETSFLGTPAALFDGLYEAGFTDAENRISDMEADPGGAAPRGAIGPAPAMGDDMPERLANVVQSLSEGRLVSMMIVAKKPG